MRYVLFVASDGLDALEGDAVLRKAPHSKSIRVVCASPDGLTPDSAEPLQASNPAEAHQSLSDLPRPSLVVVVGNTPLALWASMWAACEGIPVMHHQAGLRSCAGLPETDVANRLGTALDATADLLSFIDRRDQKKTAHFSPSATRVVGWPSIEAWSRRLPSAGVGAGTSGCLALLGPMSPDQHGRVAKIIDACMLACRRFLVYASPQFRDMIVKVGVPLPDGFELRVPDDPDEMAKGVAKCRMLVTNDERLQALSAASGCHTVLVGLPPTIRWLTDQGSQYVVHVDMAAPSAAKVIGRFWESLPDLPFSTAVVPDASGSMAAWMRPFM